MCNVCSATYLIDGKILDTTDPTNGNIYEIKGISEGSEFTEGSYQISKNGKWSKKFRTNDLAGTCGMMQVDIKMHHRTKKSYKWANNHFGINGVLINILTKLRIMHPVYHDFRLPRKLKNFLSNKKFKYNPQEPIKEYRAEKIGKILEKINKK